MKHLAVKNQHKQSLRTLRREILRWGSVATLSYSYLCEQLYSVIPKDLGRRKISRVGEKGGLGSFLHVWLIYKYHLSLNSLFLCNEDIAQCQRVIELWRSAVGQLPFRNIQEEFGQNSVILDNIFQFFVLMKLGGFIARNTKMWEILFNFVVSS